MARLCSASFSARGTKKAAISSTTAGDTSSRPCRVTPPCLTPDRARTAVGSRGCAGVESEGFVRRGGELGFAFRDLAQAALNRLTAHASARLACESEIQL